MIKVLKSLGKFNEHEDATVGPDTFSPSKIAHMDKDSLESLENKINSNCVSEDEYLEDEFDELPKKLTRHKEVN